ncbi:hypothetical protein BSKO_10653 [Bryopsis sp. KO-2023]|nr:hypothetical protein BSKO_10653 [Bryopsis sp. KO-2023]
MVRPGAAVKVFLVAAVALSVSCDSADGLVFRFFNRLRGGNDARESGINSIQELDNQGPAQKLNRITVGVGQFLSTGSLCGINSIKMLVGCEPQYTYFRRSFGRLLGGLFAPYVRPEDQTRKYLEAMPLPPSRMCCEGSRIFHDNLCGCDPNTILAFRNLGIFDPLQTQPFAHFLYTERCGAITVLAEDCPNGSPFDKISNGRKLLSSA